jgi:hypothetical protein
MLVILTTIVHMSVRRRHVPEAMHRALKAAAKRKGYTGDRANRFIYGTMNKLGKGGPEEVVRGRKISGSMKRKPDVGPAFPDGPLNPPAKGSLPRVSGPTRGRSTGRSTPRKGSLPTVQPPENAEERKKAILRRLRKK